MKTLFKISAILIFATFVVTSIATGVQAVTMSGQVWTDRNGNGSFDSGEGATGVVVDVFIPDTDIWDSVPVEADGSYSIELLAPSGDFFVEVWSDGMGVCDYAGGTFVLYDGDDTSDGFDGSVIGNRENYVIPVNNADITVNIEVETGVVISGIVRDTSGQPIPGLPVDAVSDEIPAHGSGMTNASGEFFIPVLEGPAYDIEIYGEDFMAFFTDEDGGTGVYPGRDGQWTGGKRPIPMKREP